MDWVSPKEFWGGDRPPPQHPAAYQQVLRARDRGAVMHRGLIVESRSAAAVLERHEHDYTCRLLAEKMGKVKAGALVERALSKGGSFVEALGQLQAELSDPTAMLGYSPKFVDRLLADLKRPPLRSGKR
jgi:hypothetical protein